MQPACPDHWPSLSPVSPLLPSGVHLHQPAGWWNAPAGGPRAGGEWCRHLFPRLLPAGTWQVLYRRTQLLENSPSCPSLGAGKLPTVLSPSVALTLVWLCSLHLPTPSKGTGFPYPYKAFLKGPSPHVPSVPQQALNDTRWRGARRGPPLWLPQVLLKEIACELKML